MLGPNDAEGSEVDMGPLQAEDLKRGSFAWFCSWVLSEGFCLFIGNGQWAMPDYNPWAEGADPVPVKVRIKLISSSLMASFTLENASPQL